MTAVTVSLFIHLLIFVQFMSHQLNSSAQAPEYAQRINVNLLPPPQEPPQLVKPETLQPKPELKKETITEPKPVVEKKVEPKPEPAPDVVHEKAVAPRVAETAQREATNRTVVIKEHYLSNLLTYIEGHKYYPQSARSRGIEGSINVSFELLNNGNINNLKTDGGALVLRRAAEQAITRAVPFPSPPPEMEYPLQVSYAMQFRLN